MLTVLTNSQSPDEYWTVIDTETGFTPLRTNDPQAVRDVLTHEGHARVLLDVDGNGTMRPIPANWIGDGEPLEGSRRCLDLV